MDLDGRFWTCEIDNTWSVLHRIRKKTPICLIPSSKPIPNDYGFKLEIIENKRNLISQVKIASLN